MSPPAPLSSVLSLPALGQGAQPASSPRPLLVLNPDPPPQALQRHPTSLQPLSCFPTHPFPPATQDCERSVSSHPPFLSPSSANSLVNEPLCLTPVPPTSYWLSVPPISFTGFWVQHLLPSASSPPLPLAFTLGSESQLPIQLLCLAQPAVHSLSRHLVFTFFFPSYFSGLASSSTLPWFPPGLCEGAEEKGSVLSSLKSSLRVAPSTASYSGGRDGPGPFLAR